MKKNQQPISPQTQHFLIAKINKVQQELTKLSDLISNDEQLNNGYIKKFLEQRPLSQSESDADAELENISRDNFQALKDNEIYKRVQDCTESFHNRQQIQTEHEAFSETISKLSIIKNKQNDTTMIVRFQNQGLVSSLSQGTKENNRTQENLSQSIDVKFHITKKINNVPEQKRNLKSQNFIDTKVKPKIVISGLNKINKGLNSASRIKPKLNLSNKKSHKELPSPYLSKRKSTKVLPQNYKNQSNHFFEDTKKTSQKLPYNIQSPKLNKINANKFKQNIKKTIQTQNEQQGLHSKFHLNLSQSKSLMARILQRNNFQFQYEQQTKKYQKCIKQLTESLVMKELDTDFKQRSQSLKLIMVFLSQFSQTIRKFFKNKAQHIQMKFNELIKQTIIMLIKLPQKLYKNNFVSHIQYESLVASKIAIHKPNCRLQQTVQSLRQYMSYLSKNGLIQMTQRSVPHSERKMKDYYSHRSKQEKAGVKEKLSDDQIKLSNKLYDTERKSNLFECNINKPFTNQYLKKHKSPDAQAKLKIPKAQKKVPTTSKNQIASGMKGVKSQGVLKQQMKVSASIDLLRKRI